MHNHVFPVVRIIAKKPKANKTDIKIPIPRPLEFRSVVVFFSASFVLFIFFPNKKKKNRRTIIFFLFLLTTT